MNNAADRLCPIRAVILAGLSQTVK